MTKLLWLISGTILVFLVRSPAFIVGITGLLFWVSFVSKISVLNIRGFRMFLSTAFILAVVQLIFNRDGRIVIQLGLLKITDEGIQASIYIAGRFLIVVLLSYLFVYTTSPNDLAYALMQAGMPYRFGFTLITALRLVPIFEQEGEIVYNAQLARGVQYDVKRPRRFLLLARQFALPLLVSSLGKVDTLSVSMEGRCFGKHQKRTYLRQTAFTQLDYVLMVLISLIFIGIIFYYLTPGSI
jgi:energy-coupling factor transport system permease protein